MSLIISKFRLALKDIVDSYSRVHIKDRLYRNDIIRFILPGTLHKINQAYPSDYCGGSLVRVLAKDSSEADKICQIIQDNKSTLSVQNVTIEEGSTSRKFEHVRNEVGTPFMIVADIEPLLSLKSSLSVLNNRTLIRDYALSEDRKSPRPKNVLLEYSSPNMAKPFHFGHLRSTLLGNYLSNLLTYLGDNVSRLNYIGDWGTQYGLLSVGLDKFDTDEDLSPLRRLVNIYVKANEAASQSNDILEEARRRFRTLEEVGIDSSNVEHHIKWSHIRELSLNELKSSYDDLGVEFDAFDFESRHATRARELVAHLVREGIAYQNDQGLYVANLEKNGRSIERPLLKSDGTSLYLSRDLASAINRKEKFNCEEMMYVVGADQETHMHSLNELFKMVNKLNNLQDTKISHIKLGKVRGMSTRSGNFVLLSDILNEATDRFCQTTRATVTSKVRHSDHEVGQVGRSLALAALFVYDLKMGRTRDYDFIWSDVMDGGSTSGINLQTCYARLSSLMGKAYEAGIKPVEPEAYDSELDIQSLIGSPGFNLIAMLNQLDAVIYTSYWTLDPAHLLRHTFTMCRCINRARRCSTMQVIGETNLSAARTRLTILKAAHDQLEFIIQLIGLKPLKRT